MPAVPALYQPGPSAPIRPASSWASSRIGLDIIPGGQNTLAAALWERPAQETGDTYLVLQGGDSGGPIFYVRPDGTRDVIGVASNFQTATSTTGGQYSFGEWVDITSPDAMS